MNVGTNTRRRIEKTTRKRPRNGYGFVAALLSSQFSYWDYHLKHNSSRNVLQTVHDLLLSVVRTIAQESTMVASGLFQWIGGSWKGTNRNQQQRRRSSRRSFSSVPEQPALSTIDEDKPVLVFDDDYDFDYKRKHSELHHFLVVSLLVIFSMALAARVGTLSRTNLPATNSNNSYGQIPIAHQNNNNNNNRTKTKTKSRGLETTQTVPTKTPPLPFDARIAHSNFEEPAERETTVSASGLRLQDETITTLPRTNILATNNQNHEKPPSTQYIHGVDELVDELADAFLAKKMEEGLRRRVSPRRR